MSPELSPISGQDNPDFTRSPNENMLTVESIEVTDTPVGATASIAGSVVMSCGRMSPIITACKRHRRRQSNLSSDFDREDPSFSTSAPLANSTVIPERVPFSVYQECNTMTSETGLMTSPEKPQATVAKLVDQSDDSGFQSINQSTGNTSFDDVSMKLSGHSKKLRSLPTVQELGDSVGDPKEASTPHKSPVV